MTIAELKALIANLPDNAEVMIIDSEDSCAHLMTKGAFVHSDGTLMLPVYANIN